MAVTDLPPLISKIRYVIFQQRRTSQIWYIFANIFANKLFSTSRYHIALLGIIVGLIAEKDDKRYHSEVLGGTIGLYLLIRVSVDLVS